MLTQLHHDELLIIGARVPAERLVAQAAHTLRTAAREGRNMERVLPRGYLAEVRRCLEEVSQAQRQREIREVERRHLDEVVAEAFHEAKVWRRHVAHRIQEALHLGIPVWEELVRIREARTAETLSQNLIAMVELLEPHIGQLPGQDWKAVLDRGRRLAETLDATLAASRLHLHRLPESVREYYAAKGRLYMALKVINDAGWSLHSDSGAEAARFNLDILYCTSRGLH